MKVRPNEVDEALDYLLDYECFTPYINRITLIRDYILELEEKNNIKTDLTGGQNMLLDAKEAKRQSEQNAILRLQERKAAQLTEIEEAIASAIKGGLESTSYHGDIYDETAERLHDAGYRITRIYYEDTNYARHVVISWKDVE